MLWLKAFHIVFVVTWFAGLFYLPRLFVYHATATDPVGIERFKIMERRLLAIMSLGGMPGSSLRLPDDCAQPRIPEYRVAEGQARSGRCPDRLSHLVPTPGAGLPHRQQSAFGALVSSVQ